MEGFMVDLGLALPNQSCLEKLSWFFVEQEIPNLMIPIYSNTVLYDDLLVYC